MRLLMRYLTGVPFQIHQSTELAEPTEGLNNLNVAFPWILIFVLASLLIVAGIILIRQSKLIRRFSSSQLRKSLRERDLLHSLINNMPDRIYVKDHESRFLIANKYVTAVLGVDDPSKVIGKTDFDFYDKEIWQPQT